MTSKNDDTQVLIDLIAKNGPAVIAPRLKRPSREQTLGLFRALRKNTQCKSLSLTRVTLDHKLCQTLRETLSGNSTLLSLEFHDVQVAPEGLKDFLKGLGESPVLKNLRMARVSFGGSELESVMKLADSSKKLISLELVGITFPFNYMAHLTLLQSSNIQTFLLGSVTCMTNKMGGASQINQAGFMFNGEVATHIASPFAEPDMINLTQILEKSPSVRAVLLERMCITTAMLRPLMSSLKARRISQLTRLGFNEIPFDDLAMTHVIGDSISFGAPLIRLDLIGLELATDAAYSLFQMVSRNYSTCLARLTLRCNAIESLNGLDMKNVSYLSDLDVSNNLISEDSLVRFAATLDTNTSLTRLNLSNNKFTPGIAEKHLVKYSRIKELRLRDPIPPRPEPLPRLSSSQTLTNSYKKPLKNTSSSENSPSTSLSTPASPVCSPRISPRKGTESRDDDSSYSERSGFSAGFPSISNSKKTPLLSRGDSSTHLLQYSASSSFSGSPSSASPISLSVSSPAIGSVSGSGSPSSQLFVPNRANTFAMHRALANSDQKITVNALMTNPQSRSEIRSALWSEMEKEIQGFISLTTRSCLVNDPKLNLSSASLIVPSVHVPPSNEDPSHPNWKTYQKLLEQDILQILQRARKK